MCKRLHYLYNGFNLKKVQRKQKKTIFAPKLQLKL